MFSVIYTYGVHNIQVIVSSDDFWKVVDELSSEFEIVKERSFDNNYDFYYLINYLGDLEHFGTVSLS